MPEQRYKIYEKMGAGGAGAVFRAYDTQLKRWVAIKRLLSASEANSNDPTATELRREADTLASLRNPNIVTIFDVASDDEGLFIVMELLEGEDLADVLARGPLSYDDFKELATQTLEGLLAAHQNHILHRDLKPENIKIERLPGGRLQSKIIDFGLARAGLRGRKQTEDQAGTVMGSIFYMAPEQLTREPVDPRTDLYSLGCVYYEALSGKRAFDGASMNEVIDKHINHEIVPLHVIAPYVPAWLSAWVLRLMSGKPDDRPADAQQAIEEFRAWEKMPTVPVGPWMPMAYYPAYGVPMPYAEQPYVQPANPGTYYPQPHDTSTQVPVYAEPVEEPVLYAEPVQEAAPVVRPPSAPVSPKPMARTPSSPVRTKSGAAKVAVPKSAPPASGTGNKNKIAMIGGGVVVAAIVVGLIMGRGRGTADSGGKADTALIGPSGPPKNIFELPQDRAFPPASEAICMQFVGNKGPVADRKDDKGNPADPNPNEPVFEWRDVAPLGNDNLLRSFNSLAEHSPRRVNWPSQAKAAGAKPNRPCLDFRLRDGTPSAMNLTDPESMIEDLPFGSHNQVGKLSFSPGVTVIIAFQANQPDLPTRVLTLTSGDGASLSLRVDEQKNLVAEGRAGGSSIDIKSKDVNGTAPCIASISWGSNPAEIQLSARDANGKTFRGDPSKIATPGKPMGKLQVGRVLGANNQPVTKADSFSGFIAEVIVYSTALQQSQMVFAEGQLRDYYFQAAAKK